MSRQRWLILVALAVLGYGSLWLLYPRFSPAAAWHYQLDRELALERARAVAREFGVETTGWREQVAVSRDRENPIDSYLQQHPATASERTQCCVVKRASHQDTFGFSRSRCRWIDPEIPAILHSREARGEYQGGRFANLIQRPGHLPQVRDPSCERTLRLTPPLRNGLAASVLQ